MWKLFEPVDGRGNGRFTAWRDRLQKGDQAAVDEKLRSLQIFGAVAPCLKGVTGYGRLRKIHISTPTLALRPLVCRGPDDQDSEFTLLLGAREVNWDWEPDDAPATADRIRAGIEKGTIKRIPYQVPQP